MSADSPALEDLVHSSPTVNQEVSVDWQRFTAGEGWGEEI